jgi:hypothetical protein|nr:MAG TPA: DNA-directed RNA polymerase II subunit [Caudoviricetes sp.]
MMADYIRREDALFALRKAERGGSMTALTRLERAYAEIREMLAADVAEVVHGEWLRSDDDWNSLTTIQCSSCGEEWCFETDDDVSLLNYKHCPNCGAKIDGGKDNG